MNDFIADDDFDTLGDMYAASLKDYFRRVWYDGYQKGRSDAQAPVQNGNPNV